MTGERPRVLVLHPFLEPGPSLVGAQCDLVAYPAGDPLTDSAFAAAAAAAGCAGVLSQVMDPIGEALLATPGLRIVSNVAVGFNNIDLEAATRRGVLATNTPGVLDETTADFAWALLMAAARRVGEGERLMRSRAWKGWAIDQLLGQDVHGATLGVVGFGRIGRAVARRAGGFQMRVLYSDVQPAPPEVEAELGATHVPLEELLRESDFVTLHALLLPETTHLIGAPQFALMKPTAILVNAARGPIVDEPALVAALRSGEILGAGIDVYEAEPGVAAGLLELDNVVLAPHIASASVRTRSAMSEMAARNLLAGLAGERPPNLLNPEAFGASGP
ncbi:MAG: D-glycerate dehydrogenase [Actinomycetota bacterium]|nr:D-glycerate dehydrogenase [Actinomycetota bacterium]